MTNELPGPLDLVPNLGVLDKLLNEKTPEERRPTLNRHTEQLAYYLRGACHALDLLEDTRNAAADQFVEMNPDNPRGHWMIYGDLWDRMGFAADQFLTYMRRASDSLVNYLARCPINIPLPESFNDLASGLKKQKYHLDPEIERLVASYWEETGNKIKGYRDQTLHKAVIVSNCVMFYHPVAGTVGLRMLLPHNPHEMSPTELKYEPEIHAMSFFVESLYETVRFVNLVVERLIDLTSPDPNVRDTWIVKVFARGDPITFFKEDIHGEAVPYTVTASEVVRRAVQESARRTPIGPIGEPE